MGRAPASFLRKNMDKKLLPRAYHMVSQLQKMKVPVQMNIGFYVLFSHGYKITGEKSPCPWKYFPELGAMDFGGRG